MQKTQHSGITKLGTGMLLAAAPFLLATALPAQARDSTARDTAASSTPPKTDSSQSIVLLLTVANKGEIDAAKLAVEKATRADVKAFAKRLVDEHSKALQQLGDSARKSAVTRDDTTGEAQRSGMRGIAGQYSVNSLRGDSLSKVPGASDAVTIHAANQAAIQKLSEASGATFDQTFLATQIEGHELLLKILDKNASTDAKLQGVVAEMKTAVQQHLAEAKQLQSTLTSMRP
jgi:putative membrane protein